MLRHNVEQSGAQWRTVILDQPSFVPIPNIRHVIPISHAHPPALKRITKIVPSGKRMQKIIPYLKRIQSAVPTD